MKAYHYQPKAVRKLLMRFWLSLFLVTFFFVPGVVYAEALTGKVVGVHDGDTITVLTSEKKSFKIRLAEIDTPESKQPYNMFLIHF